VAWGSRNARRRIERLLRRRPRLRGVNKPQKKPRQIGRKRQKKHRHKKPTKPLLSTTCWRNYEMATTLGGAPVGRVLALSTRENRRCHPQTMTRPLFRCWAVPRRILREACLNSSRPTVSCRIPSRHCHQRYHRHPGGVDYGLVT
jgi:hypothetical protein